MIEINLGVQTEMILTIINKSINQLIQYYKQNKN
jgi:hypothetical protein